MPYTIELHFSNESNDTIRHIWRQLESEANQKFLPQSGFPPHLTLCLYKESARSDEIKTIYENIKKGFKKFNLLFSSFGLFKNKSDSSLFLCPTKSTELNDLYDLVYNESAQIKDHIYPDYMPNNWTSHCTLSMKTPHADLPKCFESLIKTKLPITIEIEKMHFEKFE